MKPKPDFETPFEESLATFEVAPLPAEWKADLIDNALSKSNPHKILRIPTVAKAFLIGMAACWIATGVLTFLTPVEDVIQGSRTAERPELSPKDLPLLVQYFEKRNALNAGY